MICSLEADLPTSLEVFGSFGRIMINDFFILPKEMLVYRVIIVWHLRFRDTVARCRLHLPSPRSHALPESRRSGV